MIEKGDTSVGRVGDDERRRRVPLKWRANRLAALEGLHGDAL